MDVFGDGNEQQYADDNFVSLIQLGGCNIVSTTLLQAKSTRYYSAMSVFLDGSGRGYDDQINTCTRYHIIGDAETQIDGLKITTYAY